MNTIVKIGLVAGIGYLLVWGAKKAQNVLNQFTFDVVGYGRPSLSGMIITVPLQIRFSNPTSVPIVLDRFTTDMYINKNGQYVPAAKLDQALTVPAGVSTQWIMPQANLQSIFSGSLIDNLTSIQAILLTKKLTIRSDIAGVFKGIPLPMQSITSDLSWV